MSCQAPVDDIPTALKASADLDRRHADGPYGDCDGATLLAVINGSFGLAETIMTGAGTIVLATPDRLEA